jgi:hypothetical protein
MKLNHITLAAALAAVLAGPAAFAQNPGATQPEAQMSGNPKAEAAAENKHKAKPHGIDNRAKQPEAQKSGSPKAEAVAERTHKAMSHGKVNDAADKRLEKDHPNH